MEMGLVQTPVDLPTLSTLQFCGEFSIYMNIFKVQGIEVENRMQNCNLQRSETCS